MPPLKINAKLLPMKAHYFLFNVGIAPFMLFGPTIAKQLGYSALTVGSIYTVLPLIGMVSKPIVGAIADKFKQRRLLFLLTIVLSFISVLFLIFVPNRQVEANAELHCHQELHMVNCADNIDFEFKNQVKANNLKTGSISCELSCKGTAEFMKVLCLNWHVDDYCASSNMVNSVHDYHFTKGSKLEPAGKDAIPKVRFNDLKPVSTQSTFKFISLVNMTHVFLIGHCKYARLVTAQFSAKTKSVVPYCDAMINTTCKVSCKNIGFVEAFDPSDKNVVSCFDFWLLFVLFIVIWASVSVNNSISDTVCFDLLGDEPHKYGYSRLFGSLGWGISSFLSGWVTDYVSNDSEEKNYVPVYIMSLFFLALDIFIATLVRVEQKKFSLSIWRDMNKLFGDVHIVIFAIWCFWIGFASALIWQFLFWHLENISSSNDLEWSKTLQGLDAFVSTILGELPFFFIAGWFISKFGHKNIMSIVLFGMGLRLFLYSLLERPVWVLPIELTNGLTYGLFYTAMASYASIIAPPGAEATTQGLFSSCFDGFGVSLGSFVGGFVFQNYSGAVMYRIFGLLSFLLCVAHILVQYFVHSPHKYENNKKDYNSTAHYSTPNEAAVMLEERS